MIDLGTIAGPAAAGHHDGRPNFRKSDGQPISAQNRAR